MNVYWLLMWGFVIYMMRLADYFYGRRGRKKCDVCGKKFDNIIEMEAHRRDLHPDAVTS
jgi:hypothetical protein